jgi:hypothetical protein
MDEAKIRKQNGQIIVCGLLKGHSVIADAISPLLSNDFIASV